VITKQNAIRICRKLGLKERTGGKEIQFKLVHNGITVLTTAVPKGKGELHIEDKIRKQLGLNHEQFAGADECPFKEVHYLKHLGDAGRLPGAPTPAPTPAPAPKPKRARRGGKRR